VAVAPVEYLDSTVRYGSQCNFFGHEYVHAGRVSGWSSANSDVPDPRIMQRANDLVDQFDQILSHMT